MDNIEFDLEYYRRPKGGFTLISVLLLLALLVVLALSLGSFLTLTMHGVASARYANYAKESALFGLNLALGELQANAGPDQRVTAPASILGSAGNKYAGTTTPVAAQASWTGVWKSDTVAVPPAATPSYNPAQPDTKSFLGWLVSGADASGNFELPGNPNNPAGVNGPGLAPVATDVSTLSPTTTDNVPNWVTLFNNNLPGSAAYAAQVQKVQIDHVPGGTRYFAFWVEDEGVKADLSWNQTPAASTTSERAQAIRLAAAPGPDYAELNGPANNGPFNTTSYPMTYPLANDGTTPFLTNSIANIQDPLDLVTTMPLVSTVSTWLTQQRQNLTWGSRGVLADVKLGGLRRDLSLAFEMDGTTDFPTQPANFNAQTEEFVGKAGGDQLDSPYVAQGMTVPERFLYRNTPAVFHTAASFPGHGSLASAAVVARGPNWWALRDYANLYKRLTGGAGTYTLRARAYYPNVSSAVAAGLPTGQGGPANYCTLCQPGYSGELWDEEKSTYPAYIYKPARANYAPVLLGATCMLSVLANNYNAATQQADLALGVDPLMYIWNPFNRALTFQNLGIVLTLSLPGEITIAVKGSTAKTTTGTFGPVNVNQYLLVLANTGGSVGSGDQAGAMTYMVQGPVTMSPGEVMIVSTTATSGGNIGVLHGIAQPGYSGVNNGSGVIVDNFPAGGPPGGLITLDMADPGCSVQVAYDNGSGGANSGWLWMNTSLPSISSATSLSASATSGDQIQSLGINTFAPYTNPPEYENFTPLAGTPPVQAAALLNTKSYFGEVSLLMKPALFGGNDPNPVEVFSRFNPAPLNTLPDWWRVCLLNQDFNMIGAMGANALLSADGINFSGSSSGNASRDMFWGLSYDSTGSQSVPLTDIPSTPLISLAQFSNAGLTYLAEEPYHAVGNSWSDPFINPTSPYGASTNNASGPFTISDASWLLNDALFDRYYLSGIAPAYSIGAAGYTVSGSVSATLTKFFARDPTAQANPVLHPYLPPNTTAAQAVTALSATDGYKKMGAYSLVDGSFNVNSTSVAAWAAFLRANRNLAVTYAQAGGTDTSTGTPFPNGTAPPAPGVNGAQPGWSGFSRLTDAQIWDGNIPGTGLAADIVSEVKLRGPFMSISEFINHRVGSESNQTSQVFRRSYMGALQAAIQTEEAASGVNAVAMAASNNTAPNYNYGYYPDPGSAAVVGPQTTSNGITTSITQANLLMPMAPRLSARSDTFRIRAYGEIRSTQGNRIISEIACEAVVQRVPEYMDPGTDPTHNYPWSENTDPWNPTASSLNTTNQMFGRRFKIVQFRWLNPSEL